MNRRLAIEVRIEFEPLPGSKRAAWENAMKILAKYEMQASGRKDLSSPTAPPVMRML